MPKVRVADDCELYYEISGQGEPIIFIGGYIADHLVWENIIQTFAQHYQVITFDNRGVGYSDVPDYPYLLDMFVNDLVKLCAQLGVESAIFCGSSMGGHILQVLAYRYPKLVKAAVLCNTSSNVDERFMIFAEGYLELRKANAPLRSMIKINIPWCFSENYLSVAEQKNAMIDLWTNNPNPITVQGQEYQHHALKTFEGTRAFVSKINVPCLVIGSGQDLIVPEAETRWLADNIPNAELCFFENNGHLPWIEAPEIFCGKVFSYLEKKGL